MEKFTGITLAVHGHLKILEYPDLQAYKGRQPARTLLNRRNAIHKENVSILVANAITHRDTSTITYMAFGNGGTTIDNTGTVSFKTPNDTGTDADLYNQTYFVTVDDIVNGSFRGDSEAVRHMAGSLFSDCDIRCLLTQYEPFGQLTSNTIADITAATTFGPLYTQFTFDEIGLKLADDTLITHVIFTPILKTASNLLEIIYTLRVATMLPPMSAKFDLLSVEATAEIGTFV